tara:strand:- start:108 stop:959 length:852 start_codon:yes stop_codon:yes gene_type:complete
MRNLNLIFQGIIPKFVKLLLKDLHNTLTGNFITKNLKGNKKNYLDIFNEIKIKKYQQIDNFINDNIFREIDRKFIDDLALISQVSIKKSEVNYQHGRLIYSILDNYINSNKKNLQNFLFVDVGTAKGFSSVIISKCAIDNNINFSVFSFDIIPHNKKIYWNSIKDLDGKLSREELLNDYKKFTNKISFIKGRTKKKFSKVLSSDRLNFVFLDGSHDYDDVKYEFDFIKQKQKKGDIIFFDDVTQGHFDGIVKLVDEIKKNKDYKIEIINSTNFRGYAIARKLD